MSDRSARSEDFLKPRYIAMELEDFQASTMPARLHGDTATKVFGIKLIAKPPQTPSPLHPIAAKTIACFNQSLCECKSVWLLSLSHKESLISPMFFAFLHGCPAAAMPARPYSRAINASIWNAFITVAGLLKTCAAQRLPGSKNKWISRTKFEDSPSDWCPGKQKRTRTTL